MKKRRLSQNEEAIRGILLIVVFIVGLIFLRDILVKKGVSILMLTRKDYMNAAEYYMQQKYGEKFESEYIYEGSVYVHPKSNPYWHVVVDVETKDGMTYFHDNYVGYLKKEELEKYIYELVKPIYGECKVYTHPYGFPDDDIFLRDTDIFMYAKKSNFIIRIFVCSNRVDEEKKLVDICNILSNKKICGGRLVVTYLKEEDLQYLEEIYLDRLFNSEKFYKSLTVVYDRKKHSYDGEIYVTEGDEEYGK